MNRFLRITLGLGLLLLFGCDNRGGQPAGGEHQPAAGAAHAETPQQKADTVLLNGRIYTVDTAHPWVTAVAIRDGHYVFAGSDEEARKYVGPETNVADLQGRMAMPGINDAHVHPVMGATQYLYECQFPIQSNPDEIAAALKACAEKDPQAEWIIGGQWGSGFFQQYDVGSPRAWLDSVSGDKAVSLNDDSHHNAWFNSKALALAGITRETPDPEGGSIGRDADGEPNGLLFETAARVGQKAMPDWSAEQYIAAVQEVMRIARGYGITGMKDAGAYESGAMAAYHDIDTQMGGLTLHVAADIRTPYGPRKEPLDIAEIERVRDAYASNHVHTEFVKIFLDGVPTPARTAGMLAPYLPDEVHGDNFTGNLHIAPELLANDLIALDARGFTVKMHAAGDGSVREGLDAIEAARQANGDSGLRHELAHAGYIDPVDLPRFAALDAVADISPVLWFPSPIIDAIVSAVGPRGEKYFPVRDLLDSGALVVAGTDWPAVAPNANPWVGIEALVSRRDPYGRREGQLWPEQAVTMDEALRIYTLNGARAMRLDGVTGSVETGKSADLIVLDRNLFEVPIDEVGDTEVVMTFFEGKPIYARHSEAPEQQ
jgi:predicted amidohydrolase YtcJ